MIFASPLTFGNPYAIHSRPMSYRNVAWHAERLSVLPHTNARLSGRSRRLWFPQAGAEPLSLETCNSNTPLLPSAPSRLRRAAIAGKYPDSGKVAGSGHGARHRSQTWDMEDYIRQDNWRAAFAQRPGDPRDKDGGVETSFRLFSGLDPADLPADADGFVRSDTASQLFRTARDAGSLAGGR